MYACIYTYIYIYIHIFGFNHDNAFHQIAAATDDVTQDVTLVTNSLLQGVAGILPTGPKLVP